MSTCLGGAGQLSNVAHFSFGRDEDCGNEASHGLGSDRMQVKANVKFRRKT